MILSEKSATFKDHAKGREASLVGRPDFKSGKGREPVLGGFDSHSLPPTTPRLRTLRSSATCGCHDRRRPRRISQRQVSGKNGIRWVTSQATSFGIRHDI